MKSKGIVNAVAVLPACLVLIFETTRLPAASDPVRLDYTIETVAGSNAVGDGGPALSASLSDAQGVALDAAGNIFIADANDHRVRKIAPGGAISTVAGDGFPGFSGDGGPASLARLNTPYGIAADSAGALYIADLGNHRVRKIGADGVISTVPGTEDLLAPRNVALDAAGNLYISDFSGHRIRRIGLDGVAGSIAGNGASGFSGDDGPAAAAALSYPAGLAFDAAGNLYVCDSANHRLRKISGGVITTVLGTGDAGAALPNQLNLPTGVAIDNAGDVYVADSGNQRIQMLSPGGAISTIPGAGRDLALDSAGANLYIAAGAQLLRWGADLALTTIAGDGLYGFRGDGGSAASGRLNAPVAIALDPAGAYYIADQKNLRVRLVSASGVLATAAGNGTAGPAAAQLDFPAGVALDSTGALFISDQNNDRIQKLALDGSIATIAGAGAPGFNGDGVSTAVQLFSPGPMTLGGEGSLFFVDAGNRRVRRMSPDGVIFTLAELAAGGVVADGAGNLYISDSEKHTVIRIDATGRADTIAGTGSAGFSGDGGPAIAAQFDHPAGLAADSQGNLFIADTGNNRIREVGADGVIRTIAGRGAWDFDGDGGPALAAALRAPIGLAIDAGGNVWVADTGNNRIRRLAPVPLASEELPPPSVVNAASFLAGPVAPGEIVAIFGQGIGPVTPTASSVDVSGALTSELAGLRVLFDGVAAPLFYVQSGQINAQAPYEIQPGSEVEVEVFFESQSRGRTKVPVAAAAPGVFTLSGGAGPAVALNQEGTLNSVDNPAARGSVITLYATGAGATLPSSVTGKLATFPYPVPSLRVALTVGGYAADVLFAGQAPNFAGLLQINARLPGGFAPVGIVPLLLTVGSTTSQSTATLAVR